MKDSYSQAEMHCTAPPIFAFFAATFLKVHTNLIIGCKLATTAETFFQSQLVY